MPDTLLYIVNYGEDEGFAVLSADNRTTPIYAISDKGSISLGDTAYNKPLALFFDNVYNDMRYDIVKPPVDTLQPIIVPRKVEVISYVEPLISAYAQRWGQGDGFNQYCPTSYIGIKGKTGCNAVSLTQLLSYFGYPKVIEGKTIDWSYICSWGGIEAGEKIVWPDDIGWIMRELGKAKYLNLEYGVQNIYTQENVTSGDCMLQRETLIKLGYNDPGSDKQFPSNVTAESYPLLMHGYRINSEGDEEGHAWIIDGDVFIKITDGKIVDDFEYKKLYHCVWGWDGKCNGFFAWSPQGLGGKPHNYKDEPIKNEYYTDGYFSIDVKYWGNISVKNE